jgi:NADPH-dependent 2,4-dienoyl-CoA reductase/sulfur reductase-like enzyme
MAVKLLVIGNGMVGHKLLEELMERQPPGLDITVLCEESRPAYDRVHLSEFFSGKTAQDLSLVKPGFFDQPGIQLRLAARAAHIDRQQKRVTTADGEVLAYDKLVFATGSKPFVPPIPGNDRDGCFVYRTIDDLLAMQECGARSKIGVVIGGGLLGLECAKALRDLGLETHVVEFAPRLMAVQVDDISGQILRRKIEELGVTVHTGKSTQEIVDGDGTRHRMKFADGSHLDADMIVFSAGIRPRDELARQCELGVGERGGIHVDNYCRTRDWDVYAIGECAYWGGKTFGLVAPGYDMARVVAAHLSALMERKHALQLPEFVGADMSTKLKLMGVDVASLGDAHGATPGSRSYQFSDERRQIYKKLVVSGDGKRLLGGVLVGDASEYGTLLQMMLNEIELPEEPEFLILPSSDGKAKPGLGVDALPASAQICSCNNVSKGQLCQAVADGATSIGALKSVTKAKGKAAMLHAFAHGVDMRIVGLQRVVDHDAAIAMQPAGFGQRDIRTHTHRHHHQISVDTSAVGQRNALHASIAIQLRRLRIQQHVQATCSQIVRKQPRCIRIELLFHQHVDTMQQRHLHTAAQEAVGGLDAEQAAADHCGVLVRAGRFEHLFDIVDAAKANHARQVTARQRKHERLRAGGDQQAVVRHFHALARMHAPPAAVDRDHRIARMQRDAVFRIPLARVEHDLVRALLAAQQHRQQDAVVIAVRLRAEHRDVVQAGCELQQLFHRAHASHAIADHDKLGPRCAHRDARLNSTYSPCSLTCQACLECSGASRHSPVRKSK